MTGMHALVFSREICYNPVIYGFSIMKYFKFIEYVLITLLT